MFDDVIAESRTAAGEPGWLGSEKQRVLLESALPTLFSLNGWTVKWLAPGTPSYTEASTKTIAIERITAGAVPASDEEVAENVALVLLHEALHARYSTAALSYKVTKLTVPAALRSTVEHLYQRIEDARVQRLAVAAEPTLGPHLLRFHDEAIRQREAQYRAKHGGADPWTPTPASQRDQLLLAIERWLFHPREFLTLAPAVAAELATCEATIAAAWTGTTETSGLVAIAAVMQIVAANLPS
jgi:hypothetical protein